MPKRPLTPPIPAPPRRPAREPLWPAVGIARHALVLLCLALLIGVFFGNSFRSGMTLDNRYIIEEYYRTLTHQDPSLDLSSAKQLGTIFKNDYWSPKGISGLYRPLTVLSYWLDYVVINGKAPKHDDDFKPMLGDDKTPIPPAKYAAMSWKEYTDAPGRLPVTSYHVINLSVHWLNASLLYFLAMTLVKRFWPAALAAGLFATHPIAVESVTNIIGRADMFAGVAILGGLLVHIAVVRAAGVQKLWWLTVLMLVMAFGVFSKESAGALVFIILLYDLAYRVPERFRLIDWREFWHAAARGVTITALIGFGACVALLVLLPWLTQSRPIDTYYAYSAATASADPGQARVRLSDRSFDHARQLFISNTDGSSKPIAPVLFGQGKTSAAVNQQIKIFKTADSSQWALYRASGTLGTAEPFSTLALDFVTGNGSLVDGDAVTVEFVQPAFGWMIATSVCAFAVLCLATVVLSTRNFWAIAATVGFAVAALILLGSRYQPHPEETLPGPGQLLFRLHLVPSPTLPESQAAIDAASKADQPNPILLSVRSVSLHGLWIAAALFLGVEYYFLFGWRDDRIAPEARGRWTNFYDSYFVLLTVAVLMLVTRDWIFANATPAEEPFLDNPIRGISSIASLHLPSFEQQLRDRPVLGVSWLECRMTAIKVMGKLVGLLIWPKTLTSDYSYPQIPNFSWRLFRWEDWQAIVALTMFAAIGVLTWRLWKRRQTAAVFWIGFFFLAALPTANLVYPIGSIMAERFMYVPLAGFAVVMAMLAFAAFEFAATRFKDARLGTPTAAGVLIAICLIYGFRTYQRNKVWRTDETLWRDAIQWSPRSFRCYQSLAFALYERSDSMKYLDEMISLDSAARPLVDDLPDHLNSARLYLHLGMYLSIKGDSLLQHNADGTANMTDVAQECYQNAIQALKKGSAVDRAFDETIRARQRLRNDPPERISDMGLSPIYGILAVCQSRLGLVTEALNSVQYQRQLDVADVDSYRKEAVICLDHGRLDQAAVALIQAIVISGDLNYWNMLGQLYNRSDAGKGAIQVQDGQPRFNMSQPLLRQHMIAAYSRFVRDTRRAHRPELARGTHDAAISVYGLPAELFNNLLKEPIAICTPEGIQPNQIDETCKPLN